jgi:integrase
MTKRRTIAPGIRRDASGFEARVKLGRRDTRYERFPLDTPIKEMQAWQRKERKTLRAVDPLERSLGPGRPSATGALEAAAERFLPQIAGRASFKADRSHLRAWFSVLGRQQEPLGDVAILLITTEDVNLAIAQWQTAPPRRAVRRIRVTAYGREQRRGPIMIRSYDRQTPTTSGHVVAAKTIRHRCRVLDELYRTLAIPSPVAGAKIPKVPKPHPIGVDVAIVRKVALALATAAIPNYTDADQRPPKQIARARAVEARRAADHAQTYGRFAVLATTGQRPCQVMRTQPADVKLEAGIWIVRSAKGEPVHTITLNEEMVAAWRVFIAAEAWNEYDTTLHARRVHAAGWPAGIRPYAARHSVMIDALTSGVALDDVQGLAGHTSPLTTRQNYAPLQVSRQRLVSDAIVGRFAGLFGPRLLPPPFTTLDTGKGRK